VSAIRQILEKEYGKIEDDEEEEETEQVKESTGHELPALFSLRRSPYYQNKIAYRQFEDPILHTTDGLRSQMDN